MNCYSQTLSDLEDLSLALTAGDIDWNSIDSIDPPYETEFKMNQDIIDRQPRQSESITFWMLWTLENAVHSPVLSTTNESPALHASEMTELSMSTRFQVCVTVASGPRDLYHQQSCFSIF